LKEDIAVELENIETVLKELSALFCDPSMPPLPALFDDTLSSDLAPYRKFRHVVHHGYGFQLDWDRMKEGIESVVPIFLRFKSRLNEYLLTLE
jgi:hypothetical protein